jgi:hypothetical protein
MRKLDIDLPRDRQLLLGLGLYDVRHHLIVSRHGR